MPSHTGVFSTFVLDVTYHARFSERINCDEDSRCFKHYEPQLSYSEEADEDVRIDVMKKLGMSSKFSIAESYES